jgi:hypothetical protein
MCSVRCVLCAPQNENSSIERWERKRNVTSTVQDKSAADCVRLCIENHFWWVLDGNCLMFFLWCSR